MKRPDAVVIPRTRHLGEVLTVEQFRRLPGTKPALEFVGGRVIQKMSPKTTHSVIQFRLGLRLHEHVKPNNLGELFPELRCTFGGESIVPDIAFFRSDRVPVDDRGHYIDDVTYAPDLSIEILSRGQTIREMSKKLTRAVRKGVRLAWLIQPRRERAFVFQADTPIQVLERGAVLSGGEVVPGFSLPLDEIFSWLVRK